MSNNGCFVTAADPSLTHAHDVVRGLLGQPADIERLSTGGRNSRIYCVRFAGKQFALKQYPSRKDDPRNRLATEVGALKLMERYRIDTVPRVIGVDEERGFSLLSWIEGTAVADLADADLDAAAAFLAAVHDLRGTLWAKEQPFAAEACLSGAEIERQIAERLTRLQNIADEPGLRDFLDTAFGPAFERGAAAAKADIAAGGLDFAADLPQEWQTLVPSDFGFHNSLRCQDGSLAFVDFEYFGWDDPVKLTADILLHPGRVLTTPQRRRFRQSAGRIYRGDPLFARRLNSYMPLFGLRWVLILLNEFIPERWQRRLLAGATESWAEAKASQLTRAKQFLAALPGKVED
jgi:hypothetical protein